MAATDTISVDIDPDVKRGAEKIFERLGLTVGEAISMFYRQVQLERRLPFVVELPNETTARALEEAADRSTLPAFETPEELYRDLDI